SRSFRKNRRSNPKCKNQTNKLLHKISLSDKPQFVKLCKLFSLFLIKAVQNIFPLFPESMV
ncbi:MAG: hypothetical protein IKZ86_12790, partial [Spirochaetaceae bacterium]|nr:hypothetical protein [Spirochaetaceae bacterium]